MIQHDVFYVYGTASKENPGPKVRKENRKHTYKPSEIKGNIVSITITSYGDAPELAYVEVVAVDEVAGKRAFLNTVAVWQDTVCDSAWGT